MKFDDIKKQLDAINEALVTNSSERDALAANARELSTRRAELEGLLKLVAMPASPLRAQILKAVGIESEERVDGFGK